MAVPAATKTISQALFFIGSNPKWKPLLHTSLVRSPKNTNYDEFNPKPSRLSITCFYTNTHNIINSSYKISGNSKSIEEMKNFPCSWENDLGNIIFKAQKGLLLRSPFVAALLIGVLLLACDCRMAFATSGGRMGGSSFSSSSSSWSSDDDDIYSSSSSRSVDGGSMGFSFGFLAALVLVYLVHKATAAAEAAAKTSVVKIQVGLLGTATSLQRDLNRIAETADTSNPDGFHRVLTESIQALLQHHPCYCISAFSSVYVEKSTGAEEKRLDQFSVVERSKFDQETLVNANKIKKQTASTPSADGSSNEYIVVTILVATEGTYTLPNIKTSGDLKEVLQNLASIPSNKTKAVEVLWTPQNENDTLSEQELRKDYPLLQPI